MYWAVVLSNEMNELKIREISGGGEMISRRKLENMELSCDAWETRHVI
jgi:hypothetical protein